jgi:hypothetical protein
LRTSVRGPSPVSLHPPRWARAAGSICLCALRTPSRVGAWQGVFSRGQAGKRTFKELIQELHGHAARRESALPQTPRRHMLGGHARAALAVFQSSQTLCWECLFETRTRRRRLVTSTARLSHNVEKNSNESGKETTHLPGVLCVARGRTQRPCT